MADPVNPGAPRYDEPLDAPLGSGRPVAVTVLSVVLGVFVLFCLILPAVAKLMRRSKLTGCVMNLSQLWRYQHIYRTQFGGPDRLMSPDTGGAFWLRLTTVSPPIVDASLRDILACPEKGGPPAAGGTDYRGPAYSVNTYVDGDVVGADRIGNHGINEGGSVLRKSGDAQTCAESDPLWVSAGRTTKP